MTRPASENERPPGASPPPPPHRRLSQQQDQQRRQSTGAKGSPGKAASFSAAVSSSSPAGFKHATPIAPSSFFGSGDASSFSATALSSSSSSSGQRKPLAALSTSATSNDIMDVDDDDDLNPIASVSGYQQQQHQRHSTAGSSFSSSSTTLRRDIVAIDLDGDDTIPSDSPPPIEGDLELVNEGAGGPAPITVIDAVGLPEVGREAKIQGKGYLVNSLLGASQDKAFKLGHAFPSWEMPSQSQSDGNQDLEGRLVDFDIFRDFVAAPARQPAATSAEATQNSATAAADTTTGQPSSPPQGSAARPARPPSYSSIVTGPVPTLPPSTSSSMPASATYFPISPEILRDARPHPQAFYDTQQHFWTVVCPYPTANAPSPLATADLQPQDICPAHHTRTGPPSRASREHHYVRRARMLDPRFVLRQNDFNLSSFQDHTNNGVSQHFGGPASVTFPNPTHADSHIWGMQATPREAWWDLYTCSGCRRSFAVSRRTEIPSVLGSDLCLRFSRVRKGEMGEQASAQEREAGVRDAVDFLWKALRNILYSGQTMSIPTGSAAFKRRMGTSGLAKEMFTRLGFMHRASPSEPTKFILDPPAINPNSLLTLTRAFLEVSLWSAALWRSCPHSEPSRVQNATHLVKLLPCRPALERVIGKNSIPTGIITSQWEGGADALKSSYQVLGVTPETPDDYIVYAFERQISSDPLSAEYYLEALKEIYALRGETREELANKLAEEASYGHLAYSELISAYREIGLSLRMTGGLMGTMEMYEAPSEEEISNALMAKQTSIVTGGGTESDKKMMMDALDRLARHSQSEILKATLMSLQPSKREPPKYTEEEAYSHFQMQKDVDDDVILMSASIWLNDPDMTAMQKEKALAALTTIANVRNSAVLKKYLETGQLPGSNEPAEPSAALDRPAGLQNIGNTCYLNSLLQYFFTIRELREIVLDFQRYQEDEVTEELLQSKRVGGRQVTKREIERSKKFIAHLQTLFFQLIHTPEPSVRPETELAYLALVSTRDEDEATSPALETGPSTVEAQAGLANANPDQINLSSDHNGVGGDGLILSQPPMHSPDGEDKNPARLGSPSVLGKRSNDHLEPMDIDRPSPAAGTSAEGGTTQGSSSEGDFVVVDRDMEQQSPIEQTNATEAGRGVEAGLTSQETQSVEMETALPPAEQAQAGSGESMSSTKPASSAPPLPPRPEQKRKSTIVSTNMMFGRQNDVSEAMDNVIFQIQVGLSDKKLLPLTVQASKEETERRNFVQRLFYGTTRQTLEFLDQPDERPRIREEPFSYLLVDVAQEGRDLYDGLDESFTPSVVEVEGKRASRKDVLADLPPILQIQLQRVQYDRAQARIFKSNAYMPFPLRLKMGRYVAPDRNGSNLAAKHAETESLRERAQTAKAKLAQLQSDPGEQSVPDLFREVAEVLSQIADEAGANDTGMLQEDDFRFNVMAEIVQDDSDLRPVLAERAAAMEAEIARLKAEVRSCKDRIDQTWEEDDSADYELSSVFIHLGAAGYGHYYLYQRALPAQPDRWLKLNDSTVTDVDVAEVLSDTTGSTANPYWLTYVRKDQIARRIDAVCRAF